MRAFFAMIIADEGERDAPLAEVGDRRCAHRSQTGHDRIGRRARRRAGDREGLLLDRLAQDFDRLETFAHPGAGMAGGDAQAAVLAAGGVDLGAFVAQRDRFMRAGVEAAPAFAVAVAVSRAVRVAELRISQ